MLKRTKKVYLFEFFFTFFITALMNYVMVEFLYTR